MKKINRLFILAAVLMLLAPSVSQAAVSSLSQVYYVPLPEEQIKNTMDVLMEVESLMFFAPVERVHTVISISTSANGTVIYYDHWEDGFESDMTNPIQATTMIWGDDNPGNGIPPGFAEDIINAGDTVILRNDVPVNGDPPAGMLYNGRDKFGALKPLAVTRVAWDAAEGTVIAGAVEVLESRNFGMDFVAPVGEDISADSMFEYTSLVVMASMDGTLVEIDPDGDGIADVTTTLNEGESYQVHGGVLSGATVNADKPMQAHLLTGDTIPEGVLELRWYTLFPVEDWSDSYFTPVGTSNVAGDLTDIWFYNHNTSEISINYKTQSTIDLEPPASFTVAPGGVERFGMPIGEGAHFYTGDGSAFFAVATVNSPQNRFENPDSPDNDTWDWGFSLIPEGFLTTQALVGWGPGSSNEPPTENGSPVWVTVPENTTVYVNYDGSLKTPPDMAIQIEALQSVRIFDPDYDNTGMRLFTTDGTVIAVAWGEDPDTAGVANPYLDLGTTILPLPVFSILKEVELSTDVNGDGWANPGDSLRYTITITNEGPRFVDNVTVHDEVPLYTSYIEQSTIVNGLPQSDDIQPPAATVFPLDETGLLIGNMAMGDVFTVEFEVVIADPFPADVKSVINYVVVTSSVGELDDDVEIPVIDPSIMIQKTVYEGHDGGASCPGQDLLTIPAGREVTYCFTIINTGTTYLSDVRLIDTDLMLDQVVTDLLAPAGQVSLFSETIIYEDLLNTALTTGNPADEQGLDLEGVEDPIDDDTAEVVVLRPAIDLVKEADRDTVRVGEEIIYTYIVTNIGSVTLTDVTLEDDRLGMITLDKTVLEPGESATGTASYTAQESDLPGPIVNVAVTSGQPPVGDRVSDQDDETVDILTDDQPGTGTPGYWKNHPEAWPVDEITIGGVTYSRSDAIALMKLGGKGDKTLGMFNHLVSAKLNVMIGNDSGCIAGVIDAADAWMAAYGPAGSGVGAGGDSPWMEADPLYYQLDQYNNGMLCAPHRDSLPDNEENGATGGDDDPDGDGQTGEVIPPEPEFEAPGTATPGYWKNHPGEWPVDEITIGGVTYTKREARVIMRKRVRRDKTYSMFRALVTARLNVLAGNDSSCIDETIEAADAWMAEYGPPGSGVRPRSTAWAEGRQLYRDLNAYNKGELCARSRD